MWPEVNQRVNYPIKRVLIEMESNGEIDMGNEVTKFCVSCVSIMVISEPICNFISAWNSHRIPGPNGGIPNVLARSTNRVTCLNPANIPSTVDVVASHEQRSGNTLARTSCFGRDPLCGHDHLQQLRDRDFSSQYPDMQLLFQGLLHGNPHLFRSAIVYHIQLTHNFSCLL